jgi:CheY-like chemotaxis protein
MPKLPAVLLVDDDPTTNFLNQKLLERLGVTEQVLVALNGREALDVLQARASPPPTDGPLLVFLDVNMPVLNGIQFLEAYRQLPAAQQAAAVVVLLTTSAHPQDLARAQHLAVAEILRKPLTQQKVEQVLQQYFA